MKILILTEGGKDTGFGHISRCVALAEGIKEYKKNVDIEFIIKGDNSIKKIIKNNFKVKLKDWITNHKYLGLKKVDFVIIDSYLAPKKVYDFLYNILCLSGNHKLICIDDYHRIDYPPCILINPSLKAKKIEYKKPSATLYLSGKKYIILRKDFWSVPKKYIRKCIREVLVTFGGKIYPYFTKKLLKFLMKNFPQFNYHIIVNPESILSRKNCNFNFYSYISASDMKNLMLKCDIAISGGGQTLYELARVGLPTLVICFANNQKNNIEGLKERRVIDYIGSYRDKNLFSNLKKSIDNLFLCQKRMKKAKLLKKAIDGNGVKRIVKILFG
jgi:spore coat polysaccharide biosynthesis predicted glycosyltransferase SpsG